MFATRDKFRCVLCGATADRVLPQCSSCGGESTFQPMDVHALSQQVVRSLPGIIRPPPNLTNVSRKARVEQLSTVPQVEVSRLLVHPAIDYVLGGEDLDGNVEPGIAVGSLVQIDGDPGAGKSTLLLQAMGNVAKHYPCIYGSGEESTAKIRSRAERLRLFSGEHGEAVSNNLGAMGTRIIEDFIDEVRKRRPTLAIYDSKQVARSNRIADAPKSIQMMLYVIDQLFSLAHALGDTVIILVCQRVKDGTAGGSLADEHGTDSLLRLNRVENSVFRVLSCGKNRDGPEHRVMRLAMGAGGLVGLPESPSPEPCKTGTSRVVSRESP
jgi:DNA repair protein RadA/Sms